MPWLNFVRKIAELIIAPFFAINELSAGLKKVK